MTHGRKQPHAASSSSVAVGLTRRLIHLIVVQALIHAVIVPAEAPVDRPSSHHQHHKHQDDLQELHLGCGLNQGRNWLAFLQQVNQGMKSLTFRTRLRLMRLDDDEDDESQWKSRGLAGPFKGTAIHPPNACEPTSHRHRMRRTRTFEYQCDSSPCLMYTIGVNVLLTL